MAKKDKIQRKAQKEGKDIFGSTQPGKKETRPKTKETKKKKTNWYDDSASDEDKGTGKYST